jgi:branched-chain amino acid transport system permease protein
MLLHSIIITWTSLTGGDQGLMGGIPRPPILGLNLADPQHLYAFAATLAVLCLLLMRYVLQSPYGFTLRMVRDNPERARFLGINVWRVKLYAFMLAGVFAYTRWCGDGLACIGRVFPILPTGRCQVKPFS